MYTTQTSRGTLVGHFEGCSALKLYLEYTAVESSRDLQVVLGNTYGLMSVMQQERTLPRTGSRVDAVGDMVRALMLVAPIVTM